MSKKTQLSYIAQNIKLIRTHYALSQERFSILLHSTRGMILHYESGRTPPDAAFITALSSLTTIPAPLLLSSRITPSHIAPLSLDTQLLLSPAPTTAPSAVTTLYPLGVPAAVPYISAPLITAFIQSHSSPAAYSKFLRSQPQYPVLTHQLSANHLIIQNPSHALTTSSPSAILINDNLLCQEVTPTSLLPQFPYYIITATQLHLAIYTHTSARHIHFTTPAGHTSKYIHTHILKLYQAITLISRTIPPF